MSGIAGRLRGPLGRNVTSLYAIHLAGYLLPLVSFPYLLRVLGPAGFGLYAFVIATARFGLLAADWGFAYTATRDIAVRRMHGRPVDRVVSATMLARILLVAVCAALLAVLTLTVPRFGEDAGLYWAALAGVAGSALFPLWLFQAFERLPLVAGMQLGARAVATGLIFLLVNSADDVGVAVWLWAAPWLAAGAGSIWAARRLLGVRAVATGPREWFGALREGASVFVSLAAASLYTAANVLILGFLTDNEEVGYFAAAEAIVIAAVALVGPFSQALFPRSARAGASSREEALANARRLAPYLIGLGVVVAIGMVVAAPVLGPLFFGPDFGPSVRLLQIMAVIPLAVAAATLLGPQLMLTLRMDRTYSRVIVAVGIGNVALSLALVPVLGATGSATSVALAESAIAVILFILLARGGLNVATGRARAA